MNIDLKTSISSLQALVFLIFLHLQILRDNNSLE